jgi:hypothetical protein
MTDRFAKAKIIKPEPSQTEHDVMMERAREYSAQASLAAIPAATTFVLSQVDPQYLKPLLSRAPLDENSTDQEKEAWLKTVGEAEARHSEVAVFSERLICHLALNIAAGLTSRMFPKVIPPADETKPTPEPDQQGTAEPPTPISQAAG